MRLYGGRFIPLGDFEHSDDEKNMEAISEGLFRQDGDGYTLGDMKITHTFKDVLSSRFNLNELLEMRNLPKSMISLNRVMKILLLGVLLICFLEYFKIV